jgi:hypothetical protein
MADAPTLDPFALIRGLVSRLEKGVNEYATPVMRSDGFAKGANRAMSAALLARKLARDLTQRYFEALNVPSRSDLLALNDRLQVLEDRMILIQSTLDRLAGEPVGIAALPAPARTRKPPAPTPVAEVSAARSKPAAPRRTRKPKP